MLGSREMPGAEWFPGARLNYAEHLLRERPADAARDPARLRAAPARRADLGRAARAGRAPPRPGCARSGSAPATASSPTCRTSPRRSPPSSPRASIGAIWSSCSPDFGAGSVVDRFAQIEPKVLLAVDGYRYGGKDFDRTRRRRAPARRDADASSTRSRCPTSAPRPTPPGCATRSAGRSCSSPAPERRSSSSSCRSTTRSGSSTPRARPGCRRRSSTATAGSCSSS